MVTLTSNWEDLLNIAAWNEWLKLCELENEDLYYMWIDSEACFDCKHFKPLFHWCGLQDLPNTFNPVLADFGMACMGAGKEALEAIRQAKGVG